MSNFEEVTFSPLSPTNNDFEEIIGNDDQINGNSLEDKNNNRSRRKNHQDEMTVNFTPGNSTYWGASFNFINSIVGAGIIGKKSSCSLLTRISIYFFRNSACHSTMWICPWNDSSLINSISSPAKCCNAHPMRYEKPEI